MGEEVSLIDLKVGQAVILERLDNTQHDVDVKHKQNRSDIHLFRALLQHCVDDIWKLKIKMAIYSAVGGIISGICTAVVVHFVEKMIEK